MASPPFKISKMSNSFEIFDYNRCIFFVVSRFLKKISFKKSKSSKLFKSYTFLNNEIMLSINLLKMFKITCSRSIDRYIMIVNYVSNNNVNALKLEPCTSYRINIVIFKI